MKRVEKFHQAMERKGLNPSTLAKLSGVSYTTIKSMMQRDFAGADIVKIIELCKVLDVKVSDIFENDDNSHEIDHIYPEDILRKSNITVVENNVSKKRSLKVVNYFGDISAGELTSIDPIENCDLVDLPASVLGKYANREGIFIMKVNGESMNKIIPHGSFVIGVPIYDLHELKNNDIVIYSLNNESSMKRYRTTNNTLVFSPESSSENFYDVVVPLDTQNELKVHAKVIMYGVVLE